MSEDKITTKDQFDYAWKCWSFLSEQRQKTFHYYILVLAASMAGNIAVFEKLMKAKPVILFGCWHICVGGLFFLIDIKNRKLLYAPRAALKHFESEKTWSGPKPMTANEALLQK